MTEKPIDIRLTHKAGDTRSYVFRHTGRSEDHQISPDSQGKIDI